MQNTTILINFGKNVFNYFSTTFSENDFFYLSIDEQIFKDCLICTNTANKCVIDQTALENSLNEITLKYDIKLANPEKNDNNYMALAIAAYQVVTDYRQRKNNEDDDSGINDLFTQKYNITHPQLNDLYRTYEYRIWSAVKELFSQKNRFIYIPDNIANTYYVTYFQHHLFFLNQSMINPLNGTENGLSCTAFTNIINNDFFGKNISGPNIERLFKHIKNIFTRTTIQHSTRTYSQNDSDSSNIITIDYDSDNGSNPEFQIYNCNEERIAHFEIKIDNIDDLQTYIVSKFTNNKTFIFFYYDNEHGDYELSNKFTNFSDKFFILSKNIKLNDFNYNAEIEIENCTYRLYHFDFSKSEISQDKKDSLKTQIFSKKEKLDRLGGIRLEHNTYLEGCSPDCFEDGTEIKELEPGIHNFFNNTLQLKIQSFEVCKNRQDFPQNKLNNDSDDYISGLSCHLSEKEAELFPNNNFLQLQVKEADIWNKYKDNNLTQYYVELQKNLNTFAELEKPKTNEGVVNKKLNSFDHDIINKICKFLSENKNNTLENLINYLNLDKDWEVYTKAFIIPYLLYTNRIEKRYVLNNSDKMIGRVNNFSEYIHEEYVLSNMSFWQKLTKYTRNQKYHLLEEMKK